MKVYVNGKILDEQEAALPVSDRGFLFGDALFTTMKVSNGQIDALHEHLNQLYEQCGALNIIPPLIQEQEALRLIAENNAHTGTWRLKIIVTGGSTPGFDLQVRSGRVIMTLAPYTPLTAPVTLGIFSGHILNPHAHLKTLSYLSRLYVVQEAKECLVDDCIVTTPEGFLLETSFSNIFWTKGNHLYTPDPSLPLLFGVTLQRYLKTTSKEIHFVKATLADVPEGAEFFTCNTLHGIRLSAILVGKRSNNERIYPHT